MLSFLWRATRGYRLRPWRSPYLLWRIETYWGLHAERITPRDFFRFLSAHRRELWRFLKWAERMEWISARRA
jgi:hypothetical protein